MRQLTIWGIMVYLLPTFAGCYRAKPAGESEGLATDATDRNTEVTNAFDTGTTDNADSRATDGADTGATEDQDRMDETQNDEDTACSDRVCSAEALSCCEGLDCGIWSDTNGWIPAEYYCYETCAPESGNELCGDDKTCVDVEGIHLCLGSGEFSIDSLWIRVADSIDNMLPPVTDLDPSLTARLENVTFGNVEATAYFNTATGEIDGDMITQEQVVVSFAAEVEGDVVWLLSIYIPVDAILLDEPIKGSKVGGGRNFVAYYTYLTMYQENDDWVLEEAVLKTRLDYDNSTFTVHSWCEPCPDQLLPCGECEFSFDLKFQAIDMQLTLQEE